MSCINSYTEYYCFKLVDINYYELTVTVTWVSVTISAMSVNGTAMVTSSEISGSMSVVVAGEPSESGVAHKGEQNDRQDALKVDIVFMNVNV